MSEEELKEYLKKHLSIRVQTESERDYGCDYSYTTVSIALVLDGQKIGEEESFTYKD